VRRALRWLDRALAWFVAALVVGLVTIVTSQLVDRHFIDIPIQAPDQYARIGLVWLTFLGFALAVRGNVAVRVDIIDHFLPAAARRWVGIASDAMLLTMLCVLVIKGWTVFEVGAGQIILGTPFTAGLPNAALVAGCALMIFYVALRLVARWRGHEPEPLEQPDC
jgi:TRAP-type C4-dicarboxylate transport system permease small subunit